MYGNEEHEEENEEQRIKSQLPNKSKISDMFSRLEQSLKGEMATLHGDLSQILKWVEETEEKLDIQAVEIKELKEQMKRVQTEQRNMMYKVEDQEKRNRRKNLRIWGLPETTQETPQEEDLYNKMDKIFCPLLRRSITEKIGSREYIGSRKPVNMAKEIRDIIVRFHIYKDKEQIWEHLKAKQPVKYEETALQIFANLSSETLARRRVLKPLLEK